MIVFVIRIISFVVKYVSIIANHGSLQEIRRKEDQMIRREDLRNVAICSFFLDVIALLLICYLFPSIPMWILSHLVVPSIPKVLVPSWNIMFQEVGNSEWMLQVSPYSSLPDF
jgi:hypothetical protein